MNELHFMKGVISMQFRNLSLGAILSIVAGTAQASLIDDTVNATYQSPFFFDLSSPSAVVAVGGPEFVVDLGDVFGSERKLLVDVSANTIDVEYDLSSTSAAGVGIDGQSLTLSDLDWVGTPGQIIGVDVTRFDAGSPNLILGNVAFTSDSVTIDFVGGWTDTDRMSIGLDTTHYPTIPEPSTIAMWSVLGLVGMGVYRRRRRSP